jgi:hypothetical protein
MRAVMSYMWRSPSTHGRVDSQQLRSLSVGEAPRYVIHDRDHAFDHLQITAMGIEEVPTAPRSPWQNAYAERLIRSIRRECLDHVIPRPTAVVASLR